MICINDNHTDAYFNLAAEEYVLKNLNDNVFMLWRNQPAIIVGKFQNTLAEINLSYVQQNNIKVVRRLTGGGAVFHDLGNLNFTFIENNSKGDFKKFTQPILDVLLKLGVNARFEGRNDLTIDGKKFSGNAQCVHNNRMLHHGTILFSSKMADLSSALQVNPLKFTDKAVKSVRSRVTNVSEHLQQPMAVEDFRQLIMNHIVESNADCKPYVYSDFDLAEIQKLYNDKYSTWDWNFGQSPRYAFAKSVRTAGGNIEAHFQVKDGLIAELKLYGDFFFYKDIAELEELLKGCPHEKQAIIEHLSRAGVENYIRNASAEEIVEVFF